MALFLLIASAVILICVLFNNVTNKLGMPMLLAFIALGIIFGTDGLAKIPFNDFALSEQICTTALIVIMFYGGFSTKWSEARSVAVKSVLLSTVGVVITALLTGLFCHYVLHFALLESLLIGAVISSTDAASVFSILRSKRLNLKDKTASMLEMESGSNDPCSYMLTIIILSIMQGNASSQAIGYMVFAQIFYGAVMGVAIAFAAFMILKRFRFVTDGFDAIFILAIAVMAYAAPAAIGGNGFLSTYVVGIILGNMPIHNKKPLVHFFDGLTGLMQILIFFLLGLLSWPTHILPILYPAVLIALFLTFVARPLAVFSILTPTKCSLNQQLLVSWTGLRGAASIVFAIVVIISKVETQTDIFHIVFCIVLISISLQGTLIPFIARKLDMLDDNANVLKTFSDYSEETSVQFVKLIATINHPWLNKCVKNITLPPDTLLVLFIRGGERIIPNGDTVILLGDLMVLSAPVFQDETKINLVELAISKDSQWNSRAIYSLPNDPDRIIIMIKRRGKTIIPNGRTILRENDVLVICTSA